MNNVIINIDETQDWTKWVNNRRKRYELYFLCYSSDKKFLNNLGKYVSKTFDFSIINEGKWRNIRYFIRNYFESIQLGSYFFFPDPDLEIEPDDIEGLFEIARELELDVCQPSLTKDSYCSHKFLIHNEGNKVYRKVDFCEIMCPMFSRRGLIKNLWTFGINYSGYGIDLLWGRFNNCYVIDDVQIKHPRPCNYKETAKNAGFPDPERELDEVRRMYL